MENGQSIGPMMAIMNIIPGILLAYFHKPIGSKMSAIGKNSLFDKLTPYKLYEEHNSRRVILVVGIWLIAWGVTAFFLLPTLSGNNP
ncbi:MAG: hypothetical protein PHI93_03195 [Kiritimatiellae bacterium]|jgi:hypothetical protein|nr:hypothetical protein [Kiritimatiellia bacterium]